MSRYVNIDEIERISNEATAIQTKQGLMSLIKLIPTIDIIWCKDCKEWKLSEYTTAGIHVCKKFCGVKEEYDFCSRGKGEKMNDDLISRQAANTKMKKYRKKPIVIEAYQTDVALDIETLEGTMHANVGDYIISGVNGEQYPCKSDIFEKTYEEVSNECLPSAQSEHLTDEERKIFLAEMVRKALLTN